LKVRDSVSVAVGGGVFLAGQRRAGRDVLGQFRLHRTTFSSDRVNQSLVADPEVMRDLVEHDISDLAAQTIGVACSEPRVWPAEDADLVGKYSAVRAAPSRQRYAVVQAEERPPGGSVTGDLFASSELPTRSQRSQSEVLLYR
jgi:hypothetical protein